VHNTSGNKLSGWISRKFLRFIDPPRQRYTRPQTDVAGPWKQPVDWRTIGYAYYCRVSQQQQQQKQKQAAAHELNASVTATEQHPRPGRRRPRQ